MNAFKSHGRGRLVLKGTFAGIRIERSSGTDDPKLLTSLREMLTVLARGGRLDLIRAVATKVFKPLELWEHYRSGNWENLPSPDQIRPLKEMLEAWRAAQTNVHSNRTARFYLARILEHSPKNATLAHLPAAIIAYRQACEKSQTAQMFNHVRAAAQAAIRTTPGMGRHSPLWTAIARIEPMAKRQKQPINPQRVTEAWAIRQALGGDTGRQWWELCCTGMSPDEYFGKKWAVEDGRLHVKGTKRAARDRIVPLVVNLDGPVVIEEVFRRKLYESGFAVTPRDGRRTFAVWMSECEIPENRQQAYMGHGPKTMTQRYQRVKEQYLDEDESRLRSLISGTIGGTEWADAPQIGMVPVQKRRRAKRQASTDS